MTEENYQETDIEETTSQETPDADVDNSEESDIDWKAKAEAMEAEKQKLEAQNKKLYERVKKTPKSPEEPNSQSVDVDLVQFFAKGGDKEEYAQLQKIMKGGDLSFDEALKDPLFVAYKSNKAKEERSAGAQLGASSGSPDVEVVNTKDMTPEEHRAYHKEVIANATRKA